MAQPMLATWSEDPSPPEPREWISQGICSGLSHLFFPPHAERPQARARREEAARAVCLRCPVIIECRRYARLNREYGFWGGESEEERAAAGYPVPLPIGGRARLFRQLG